MILGVCSNKGGVGKTTVSTLLAAYTAKHTEKKILLIDADHNRGSSSVFFLEQRTRGQHLRRFSMLRRGPV